MESSPQLDQTEKILNDHLERWKKSPVVLASSSTFRKEQLTEYGFQDITASEQIPDELEMALSDDMHENEGAPETHWDGDGAYLSEHIAAAKVAHVLKHQAVDPEALVVGFDTTAVIYNSATDEKLMGVPRGAEKFSTLEEAQTGILAQFTTIAEGCHELHKKITEYRRNLEQHDWSAEDIEMTVNGFALGIRRGYIHINTGVAVAFPHEHESSDPLYRWTERIKLLSQSLYEARDDSQAIEKLVELVIKTQGEKVLQISGGVDYADSYVRDILQLTERHLADDVSAESVYRGFSDQALTTVLRMKAWETVTN